MEKDEAKFLRVGTSTLIRISSPETTFAFRGSVAIILLSGTAEIFGYKLDDLVRYRIRVIASAAHSACTVNVKKCEKRNQYASRTRSILERLNLDEMKIKKLVTLGKTKCIIVFRHFLNPMINSFIRGNNNIFDLKPNETPVRLKFPIEFIKFVDRNGGHFAEFNEEWMSVMEKLQKALLEDEKNVRVMAVGGLGSGKSTLLRFIANNFLNVFDGVYYLDSDVGQPEFTPCGCVSLTLVNEPILDASFVHPRESLKAYFIGGADVESFPDHYLNCATKLFETFKEFNKTSPKPLLINTMGFVHGMGLQLLIDLINIIRPTHVIQFQRKAAMGFKMNYKLTLEKIKELQGWKFTHLTEEPSYEYISIRSHRSTKTAEPIFKNPVLRVCRMISHFYQPETTDLETIVSRTPYEVHWKDVAIYCCNEIVPRQEILYSLNAMIVALCVTSQFETLESYDPSLPRFLNNFPDGEFIAFGLIRNIDLERKLFLIVTPAPEEKLRKVNVLIRGQVDSLPELTLMKESCFPTLYNLHVENTERFVGTKQTRHRVFKERPNGKLR